MLAYPIATTALLILGQSGSAAASPADFMRAMKKSSTKRSRSSRRLSANTRKEFGDVLHGNSKKSSALRKKIIEKSAVVKPGDERKLQNYNDDANANAQNANYKSSTDDYFMAYGEWENNFGFDPTQYSLSYNRCAAVRQFDDEIAAQEDTDSVFSTKNFAVFRFCPEATCNGYVGEIECGCEDQCEALTKNNGGNSDNCEEACEEQCLSFWKFQNSNQGDGTYQSQSTSGARATSNGNGGYSYTFNMNYANEQKQKEAETVGARGNGCQSDYGEYMIEIEDYLGLMLEFQEERFETYCEYCEECMYNVYEEWVKNGGNRKLSFEDFKNSEEHRKLGGNVEGGQANGKYYKVCPEYDTCMEYQNTCHGDMYDGYSEWFECTEVERNNGQVAYVGPHCAEDGFTITLGVYGDEYCNEYIGNGVNIANFIGQELDIEEDDLKMYYNSMNGALDLLEYSNEDDVCIPCRKADMPYEDSDYEAYTDDQTQAQAQKNYGETEITEICESLYMVSARCDKHFNSYNAKSKMAKYSEAVAQEDLTCDFIDSVVMGNFDEMGYVNLGDDYTIEKQTGWLSDNMYAQQYVHYITEVTPLQIFGLLTSILAVVILGLWSASLHKSLTKRGPWRPRRGMNNAGEPQPDVNRQNSGIVMGRSQSNVSYYMS